MLSLKSTEIQKDFNVYSIQQKQEELYTYWYEGLTVVIEKNGVEMVLTGEEMRQVIKVLPKTFGGRY